MPENLTSALSWVHTHVAIGSILDVERATREVDEILSLVPLPPGMAIPEHIEHLCVPLTDGPGNSPIHVRRALGFVVDFLRDGQRVFVHCQAGRSRSVVIVAMALMQHQGLTRLSALDAIGRRREIVLTPGIEEMFRSVGG